jgi:hypothetical protein
VPYPGGSSRLHHPAVRSEADREVVADLVEHRLRILAGRAVQAEVEARTAANHAITTYDALSLLPDTARIDEVPEPSCGDVDVARVGRIAARRLAEVLPEDLVRRRRVARLRSRRRACLPTAVQPVATCV